MVSEDVLQVYIMPVIAAGICNIFIFGGCTVAKVGATSRTKLLAKISRKHRILQRPNFRHRPRPAKLSEASYPEDSFALLGIEIKISAIEGCSSYFSPDYIGSGTNAEG